MNRILASRVLVSHAIRRAKPELGRDFVLLTIPRAALVPRFPWANLLSSLQDFGQKGFDRALVFCLATCNL